MIPQERDVPSGAHGDGPADIKVGSPVIVIAPDKFKGSLSAVEVAAAVARGLAKRLPQADLRLVPVADGGEGTLDAALLGPFVPVRAFASGPTGEQVDARWARNGDVAIVELAEVSGLARLPRAVLDPMGATSRGVGELIAKALDRGCRKIILGIGGSACTDGGAGMVSALGARLLDDSGELLGEGGGPLKNIANLDLSRLHPALREAELLVACDVDNPLTGLHGAARVYAPQKGASGDQVEELETALSRWAGVVAGVTGRDDRNLPGAGAAGGVGFAALALLGARLESGVDLVLQFVEFDRRVIDADLVIVGEGSLDLQSMRGKAPVGVAAAARRAGIEVIAICGRRLISRVEMQNAGISEGYACADLEPDSQRSMANAADLVEELAEQVAQQFLLGPPY